MGTKSSRAVVGLPTMCFLTSVAGWSLPAIAADQVLHSFSGAPADGAIPFASLYSARNGKLFGTTNIGGTSSKFPSVGYGTVFRLVPPKVAGQPWTESIIYNFTGKRDGGSPHAPIVADDSGNLYGTTWVGGFQDNTGCGVVYKLSPPAVRGAGWVQTTLHVFICDRPQVTTDGGDPGGRLLIDATGSLYGTTYGGGSGGPGIDGGGWGTVYKLTLRAGTSTWTETILYNFTGGADGGNPGGDPSSGLVMDASGALYGTALNGGKRIAAAQGGLGTVFKLTPPASPGDVWTETTIYSFQSVADGYAPQATLVFDTAGNLYGTTTGGGRLKGGAVASGTVFKLAPPAASGQPWTKTTLYAFSGNEDGNTPQAGVVIDKTGNLYGTTAFGGIHGVVYKLAPPRTAGGAWKETVLHSFGSASSPDGAGPQAALVVGKGGLLYGTTTNGGTSGLGTVFSVKP